MKIKNERGNIIEQKRIYCSAIDDVVTLIFKVDERGVYSSFLQANPITDIIPKNAKNMPLAGVKHQAIMRRL